MSGSKILVEDALSPVKKLGLNGLVLFILQISNNVQLDWDMGNLQAKSMPKTG